MGEIVINRYLTEKKGELANHINTCSRVYVEANPNTGKTKCLSSIAKDILKNGGRVVFASPLVAISDQVESEFGSWDLKWNSGHPNYKKRKDDLKLSPTEKCICTTPHQLHRLIPCLRNSDIVIVDEAHSLVELSGITSVVKSRDQLRSATCKVVYLSGTPYKEDIKLLKVNKHLLVREKFPSKSKIFYVTAPSWDYAINESLKYIKEYLFQGYTKLVIYNNDIAKNDAIEKILNSSGVVTYQFNSEVKRKAQSEIKFEYYNRTIENGTLPLDCQVAIVTKSLELGINIIDDDAKIAISLGHHTVKSEKQFIKRFRKAIGSNDGNTLVSITYPSPYRDEIIKCRKAIREYRRDNSTQSELMLLKTVEPKPLSGLVFYSNGSSRLINQPGLLAAEDICSAHVDSVGFKATGMRLYQDIDYEKYEIDWNAIESSNIKAILKKDQANRLKKFAKNIGSLHPNSIFIESIIRFLADYKNVWIPFEKCGREWQILRFSAKGFSPRIYSLNQKDKELIYLMLKVAPREFISFLGIYLMAQKFNNSALFDKLDCSGANRPPYFLYIFNKLLIRFYYENTSTLGILNMRDLEKIDSSFAEVNRIRKVAEKFNWISFPAYKEWMVREGDESRIDSNFFSSVLDAFYFTKQRVSSKSKVKSEYELLTGKLKEKKIKITVISYKSKSDFLNAFT